MTQRKRSHKPTGRERSGGVEPVADAVTLPNANPTGILVMLAFGLVIALAWFGGRYVENPSELSGGWRTAAAVALAVVVGLATSTLMSLAYCMFFLRSSALSRRFFDAVSVRSAMGAVLGTLFGLRLVIPESALFQRGTLSTPPSFSGLVQNIGTWATIVTLAFIASCWWFAWPPLREMVRDRGNELRATLAPRSEPRPYDWMSRLFGGAILLWSNFLGVNTGIAVYWIVVR
jgi:hypothetical protein